MLKRPKATDSEKDILQFQNEYLDEKRRSSSFQPSAKVVRVGEASQTGKKQSLFAKSRNKEAQEKDSSADTTQKGFVIGDIVERHPEGFQGEGSHPVGAQESFPRTEKIDINVKSEGKSIFAKLREEKVKKIHQNEKQDVKDFREFGEKSFILTGAESSSIHEENVKVLSQMSKEEIEIERERLMKSLDPKLLEYIRSKRKTPQAPQVMDVEESTKIEAPQQIELPEVPILGDEERQNWLHFDKYEADKFQWMTSVPKNIPKLKKGEAFEARFDWKGILLPFVEKDDKTANNRELYLHGEDPHRPGYTIQELFRLARSNVTQQRIQALNAIAGILRIYNQGFYDDISELPISKIFFLLRFALDDTATAVVEAAAKGLSSLFSNEIDELLLDTLFETQLGIVQPLFGNTEAGDGLEKNFSKLKIESTDLDEEMSNIEQMNDFHLAETDLVKCLLRTNILKRIHFLLAYEQIPDTGVIALTRILEGCARDVLEREEILPCLIRKHLIGMNELPEGSGKVQAMILKLLRITVCALNSPNLLKQLNILPILMEYCHTRRDLNADFLQLQIESYRLEWHYNAMPFANGSLQLRQHAAVLISVLNHTSFDWRNSICSQTLQLCFGKWTTLYSQGKNHDFSHNVLITCCFELISRQPQHLVGEFVNKYFQNFLESEKFSSLWDDLITTSPLIHSRKDRRKVFEALPNLGSVAVGDNPGEPQLKLPYNYPGSALLSAVEIAAASVKAYGFTLNFRREVERYLKAFVEARVEASCDWFWQHEINLILVLLQMDLCEKNLILRSGMKVVGLLRGCENMGCVRKLLDSVIFSEKFYGNSSRNQCEDFSSWRSIYWKFYSMNLEETSTALVSLSCSDWDKELLPQDWPLALLTIFLQQHTSDQMQLHILPQVEDEIITASMGLLGILEENSLIPVSPSEEFMYLMMPFLSTECRFMEPTVKDILRRRISSLFARCQNKKKNKSTRSACALPGKHDFESVYTVFLNHFQSSSYGDDLFSAMVMVPLAQKYDAKWRKMIWSEHIAVLRFITCTVEQLCGGSIDPYLEPPETDSSLLKLYSLALNSNCLRKDSLPHKIAQHHLMRSSLSRNSSNSPAMS
uniref:Putative rna polymerase ii-associated protein 1 n=1 Tax=Lutzomyia longipalpis TaxID=7200 RepID=A0A1B0CE78_LUTLO